MRDQIAALVLFPFAFSASAGPLEEPTTHEITQASFERGGDEPVCMVRPVKPAGQTDAAQESKNFAIVALPKAATAFEAKGFVRANCSEAGFSKPDDFRAYRDQVCEMATLGNEAVQRQIEQSIGEQPSVLCANAEYWAGAWQPLPSSDD